MSDARELARIESTARQWRTIAIVVAIVGVLALFWMHRQIQTLSDMMTRTQRLVDDVVYVAGKVERGFDARVEVLDRLATNAATTVSYSRLDTSETARAAAAARQAAASSADAAARMQKISRESLEAAIAAGKVSVDAAQTAARLSEEMTEIRTELTRGEQELLAAVKEVRNESEITASTTDSIQKQLTELKQSVGGTEAEIRGLRAQLAVARADFASVTEPPQTAAAAIDNEIKPLDIILDGSNFVIHFVQGPYPYDNLTITESNYSGTVAVPKKRLARVKGSADNSFFTIAAPLQGRIVNDLKGTNNSWVVR